MYVSSDSIEEKKTIKEQGLYSCALFAGKFWPGSAASEIGGGFTTDFGWWHDKAGWLCAVIKLPYKARRPECKSYQTPALKEIPLNEVLSSLLISTS